MPVPRILALSDDARLRGALRRVSRALGYQAEARGLPRGQALPPADVVLLDARDPSALTTYLPFLMLTPPAVVAIVPPGDLTIARDVLAAGAGVLISPPIGREALRLALLTALGGIRPGVEPAQRTQWDGWLREATQEMWRSETALEIIDLMGRLVTQGLGLDRVSVWLIDDHTRTVGSWLCFPDGRPPLHRSMVYSIAEDSPVWEWRLFRELLREQWDYSYSDHPAAEVPPVLHIDTSDGGREHLAVALKLSGTVLGWISVDNKPSGRHLGPEQAPPLVAFAYEAAAALSKAQLHQAAARRAQELATLMEVSVAVATQRDPRAVCQVAVEQLVSRFGHELVSIYLNAGHELTLQAQLGYTFFYETPSEQGVIGRTMRLGTPQFVPDVREDPDYMPASEDVVGELCVPILIGDRVEGVINVESRHLGLLDSQTQELLILLAQQVAITVERGRLLEQERRRANLAEALTRATATLSSSLDAADIYQQMLELLNTVVNFDTANIYRIEDGFAFSFGVRRYRDDHFGSKHARFQVQSDPIFAPWVRGDTIGPVLILDTRNDPRWSNLGSGDMDYIRLIHTYMAIPLLVDGELVGALTLGCFAPNAFDEATVTATLEFGERLTRALRNARMYELERAANQRLQSIMRLQDEFVATVSHELRTPLTSILGFSENLLDHWHRFDDAQRQLNVEKILRSGRRLHRLVRDLLQISRLEAGSLRVAPADLHLMPIIRQAVEELTVRFSDQTVHLGPGVDEATLWADADRLRQVIGNLLDNAAKYSPPGSAITIGWSSDPPWGTIKIYDQGSGIRQEDITRLFRRFGKLDTVARAGHVGTGLGLYICKQLVESMGGKIWYDYSEHPRPEGRSAFCIRLPLTEPGALAAEPALLETPPQENYARLSG